MALEININAPDFTFATNNGSDSKLSDYKGKWIVLYFYPKDNTSGCTAEACDFRDNMERITTHGAVVLGVSPDGLKSHDNFTNKYNLNFQLISDTDKVICNMYVILGEKSMYGRKYIGVVRTTYIISPDGVIVKVFSNVKVNGHVDEVIKTLEELAV